MERIEVSIISKHTIKPSASFSLLQPYKLSLLDQLTPALYIPMIFFYPITNPTFNLPQTLADLRLALSEALTLYYPLSGRVKNNVCIDDFDAGVPYIETLVKCDMNDFLGFPKIECLEDFVPMKPYSLEAVSSDEAYPLLGAQVNVFDNGIAIGVCTSHKLMDARTTDCLLTTWGAVFRSSGDEIIRPNLSEAALVFPPRNDLSEKFIKLTEGLWFAGKKVATRRFVFDAKAICALKDDAKSELVPNPSRVQTVTGFLWKHIISASHASTDSVSKNLHVAAQAVNIRSRINQGATLDNAIGNLMWWAPAILEPSDTTIHEIGDLNLCDMVNLLNESIKECNSDFLETYKGVEGYESMCEYLDRQMMTSSMEPAPEICSISSWNGFFNEVDFGWGKTSWIGVMGKIETAYCNLIVLVPTQCNTGVEAWVNLDEEKMAMLEKDPQFLRFASPNPNVSRY